MNQLFPSTGGSPIILSGDLNARSGSLPIKELFDRNWIDATARISRIDYVFFRRDDPWHVVEVKSIDEPIASDHLPVLAVLEWTGEN